MDRKKLVDSVKETVVEAKSKVERVAAHSQEVVKAGVETLTQAKQVVGNARREAAGVVSRTKEELKRTLKEGAAQVGDRIAHLAQATRKEQAESRKAEVKAKKRARKQAQAEPENSPEANA
jgi:hypothetical protein